MKQVGRKLEGRGAVEEDAATERAERRRRTDEETHEERPDPAVCTPDPEASAKQKRTHYPEGGSALQT